jgi:hypothetical protein
MPSSRQIISIALIPLAFALPQPQNGAWGASETTEAAGTDTWAASTAADTWGAGTATAADTWAATTAAPAVSEATGAYNPSAWLTQVTYPAGCQSWANPCPSGAVIAGGGEATAAAPTVTDSAAWGSSDASYTNGFTSFTTMTNSEGIITGMPSKATIAAGVTTTPSFQTSMASMSSAASSASTIDVFGANATTTTPSASSTTSSGFAQESGNSAAGLKASAALCALAAIMASIL